MVAMLTANYCVIYTLGVGMYLRNNYVQLYNNMSEYVYVVWWLSDSKTRYLTLRAGANSKLLDYSISG